MRSTTFTTRIFSSGSSFRRILTAASVSSVGVSPQQAITTSGSQPASLEAHSHMQMMGITDTQFIIVRHHNTDNPHCHIVYNRINNEGKLISDMNDYRRNEQVTKALKTKYGLTYGTDKSKTNTRKLRNAERAKYEIHNAVKDALEVAGSWQTDVFFYNAPKSTKGRRLANNLHRTFDRKYDKHQPNRGFRGTVSERNLYVLRNTTPVAVFLELGNIRNKRDQQRLVLKNNRQALANWIAEGIVKDYKQGK